MHYNTVQYNTVQCITIQYSSIQFNTVQYSRVIQIDIDIKEIYNLENTFVIYLTGSENIDI